MILILTDKNDAHANYVIEKIKSQNLPYARLNLDVESLMNTILKYQNGAWDIRQNNKKIDLSLVKCVWNRRTFVELLLEEEYNQTVDFKLWKNEWNKTLLGIYSNLRHLKWLNLWLTSHV